MMFVSVVIPAFNEEKYLGACLHALRRQTYPANRYEVIVVNNASTDATATIARRYGARVVWEPRRGIPRARQAGFRAARGEIIASTDADTVVPPDWIERIVANFQAHPEWGGLYGPVYWPEGRLHERLIMRYPVTWMLALSNRLGRSYWIGSNFAVRREPFWQVGGFNEAWESGEDGELALRMGRITQIGFDPKLVVYSSNRRAREGAWPLLRRALISRYRTMILRQAPLPPPAIR
ncbi:MAG TPA: glycosyltransferase family 2 protein [Caldilineae bacterium]|nr:glycosyltransferase family 2 protein [Caldilineae bacterium]